MAAQAWAAGCANAFIYIRVAVHSDVCTSGFPHEKPTAALGGLEAGDKNIRCYSWP